ncbi:MAG: amidase family protein, partial [Sphingobium sp.]
HDGLPMGGVLPFAHSFDDVGPFTLSIQDMQCVWSVLAGATSSPRTGALRIARLDGRFRDNADPGQIEAIDAIAPDAPLIELPDIGAARSAAFLITAAEGGALHRAALARDPIAFDPATRDRLIAGALLPPELYAAAQDFKARYRQQVNALIADYDVLLAPATPCVAPLIADPRIRIDGAWSPARADLGIHSQPISFTGLPSLSVPLNRPGKLPIGIQLIGKAGDEATLFRFAAMLEEEGRIGVTSPAGLFQGDSV